MIPVKGLLLMEEDDLFGGMMIPPTPFAGYRGPRVQFVKETRCEAKKEMRAETVKEMRSQAGR